MVAVGLLLARLEVIGGVWGCERENTRSRACTNIIILATFSALQICAIPVTELVGFVKMTEVATNKLGQSFDEANANSVFDLGAFVGDLTVEEDANSDDISLEGLQQELEECKNDDVVANILSKGTKLREYTKGVENNLRQVELDSIQDYIEESDNLVSLHDQIRDCDHILSQMETLLSGFQVSFTLVDYFHAKGFSLCHH
ncbi:hypothetical protein RJ639_036530 [Escallonia herrerae]|uniref:Vps52 coiled-coil domain-containing protein n=1 Tax=Escallonia herrerae TaxID=1293975 RepID=A0AA89B7W5_9ASTE|nr:hypothetical protein RJ639_036530 [Escallonia herrerae]